MLTREQIDAMTDKGRTQAMMKLCKLVYGEEEPNRQMLAHDLGVTVRAYAYWKSKDKVPVWVLLLLSEWTKEGHAARAERLAWSQITNKLSELTQMLHDLAEHRAAASFGAPHSELSKGDGSQR